MDTDALIILKMLKYCDDATKYVKDSTYPVFSENELHLTFSVFSLSQLGEMACRLDSGFYERYPEIPWRAIRGVRNRIVHNYDSVMFTVLWDVLTQDIPTLREQLLKILGQINE